MVDTGNGAAAGASHRVPFNATWVPRSSAIHVEPDGYNINEGCGSTHMADLRAGGPSSTAHDVGIAHDGDADRCLAVDAQGNVVDGDEIMAILALAMRDQRQARPGHGRGHGDEQPRVQAGDGATPGSPWSETGMGNRYVLEAMRAHNYSLGGEQSGHVVLAGLRPPR